MGQIFHACAYDTDTNTCCVYEADKFHANCYSFGGIVLSMHYLLRQKPYRIMWGGGYVFYDNNLSNFSRIEDLLGFSTYCGDYELDADNDKDYSEDTKDKMKVIIENKNRWTKLDIWDEAIQYFDWQTTRSVRYSGYLINHTKKSAIDLADYYRQSHYFDSNGYDLLIDVLPVLTETGEGAQMAFYNGISADTTEKLAGTWCGDLLQIVDDLPDRYELINCCFVEIWTQAKYFFHIYGVNEADCIIKDEEGNLYEAVALNFHFERGTPKYIKAVIDKEKNKIKYSSVEK